MRVQSLFCKSTTYLKFWKNTYIHVWNLIYAFSTTLDDPLHVFLIQECTRANLNHLNQEYLYYLNFCVVCLPQDCYLLAFWGRGTWGNYFKLIEGRFRLYVRKKSLMSEQFGTEKRVSVLWMSSPWDCVTPGWMGFWAACLVQGAPALVEMRCSWQELEDL